MAFETDVPNSNNEKINRMLWDFFLITLKVGTFAFGGGYAMISPLHYELVTHLGWLTEVEFSSAVAIGQMTPGPLMIMIAFMGYKIAGLLGATVGTIGLFLPSALIVLAIASSYLRFKDAPIVQGALRGVSAAVIGLLAAVVIDLGRSAILGPFDALVALAAFILAGPLKTDPIVMLIGAGAAGVLRYLVVAM